MREDDMSNLHTEIYLIDLLEKVEAEMAGSRLFLATKQKVYPTGLEIYDNLHDEVKNAIKAYRDGKWQLHIINQLNLDG